MTSNQAAEGTTDIAIRNTEVVDKTNAVMDLTREANQSAQRLKSEITHFKI